MTVFSRQTAVNKNVRQIIYLTIQTRQINLMNNNLTNTNTPRTDTRSTRQPRPLLRQFAVIAISMCTVLLTSTIARADNSSILAVKASIELDGREYFHRNSGLVQHEFTPDGETDLDNWTDMLTIVTYKGATDEASMEARAKAVLATYQQSGGKVLKAATIPPKNGHPADHFMTAVFASPDFIEYVQVRLRLSESLDPTQGLGIVHSHRIYGSNVGEEVRMWALDHEIPLGKALLTQDTASATESALKILTNE